MNRSYRTHWVVSRSVLTALAVTAIAASLAVLAGHSWAAAAAADGSADHGAAGNWNFETGDFTGWHTTAKGDGAWRVYADGRTPPVPADSDPNFPFSVPQPSEGKFAAVTDMSGPGARILYRDVRLHGRVTLRMTLFYVNVGDLASPRSLRFGMRKPNQQFRVDLMDPAAPLDSVAAQHVLRSIFRTAPGDPDRLAPRTVAVDLSRWANTKIRIRVAQVDNQGPMRAGVDDVGLQRHGS